MTRFMGRRRSLVATVATVFAGVAVAVAAVAGVGPSAVAADAVAGQDARPPPPSADPSADPLRLTPPVDAPLFEPFAQGLHASGWQVSKATKVAIDAADAELVIYQGRWELARPSVHAAAWAPDDRGLVMQTPNANHAIARPFATPMLHALPATGPPEHPLVVQYEVKLQDGLRCGGAYLKLLPYDATARFDATRFHDKTPFTIQFGPDACDDRDRDGVHFHFRHTDPTTGRAEMKRFTRPPPVPRDALTHLYTLVVYPDNTFVIQIDRATVAAGSLLEDMVPPVTPPREIDDPAEAAPPPDWVERTHIPDPAAVRPADWDDAAPRFIPDPDPAAAAPPAGWLVDAPPRLPDPAVARPALWNETEDGAWAPPERANPACAAAPGCGAWTPPHVPNPAYRGPWTPPLVPNPAYVGPWRPRRIPNPDYFEDPHPARFTPLGAVAFDLWSLTAHTLFDNLYVGHRVADAARIAEALWAPKFAAEQRLAAAETAAASADVTAAASAASAPAATAAAGGATADGGSRRDGHNGDVPPWPRRLQALLDRADAWVAALRAVVELAVSQMPGFLAHAKQDPLAAIQAAPHAAYALAAALALPVLLLISLLSGSAAKPPAAFDGAAHRPSSARARGRHSAVEAAVAVRRVSRTTRSGRPIAPRPDAAPPAPSPPSPSSSSASSSSDADADAASE